MAHILHRCRLVLGALVVAAVLFGPSVAAWASGPADGVTWTARTSAADNRWIAAAYGNGVFVATARDGGNQVMTSPDGITWTPRSSAANNGWMAVTYGNGLFVAVAWSGSGNRVMTSPDGITWTIRASAADNEWRGVTYANGLFVAVAASGSGNRVMTSPDGITWTSRTSPDDDWVSVTYGNGVFVAVAWSGAGGRVMTSPDGITWTARASATNIGWHSVTYGNGVFVAVATYGGPNQVMTSPDGITWTTRAGAPNTGNGVTFGNGLFVAVAPNQVMTSPDGITWTARTSAASNAWGGLAYGGGVFVAVAQTGAGNRVMTNGTFDAVAPGATAVLSGPGEGVVLPGPASAAFVVSAADNAGGSGVVGYRCRLDGPGGAVGSWVDCASSQGYSALADGSYTFSVRAVDGAGLLGPVTTRSWRVSSAVPDTRLDEGVPAYLSAAGVTLRVSSDQSDASFQCRVDNETWAACASPATFALDEGVHTLQARAVSASGVVDPDPVVVSVVIDRTAPRIELEASSVQAGKTTADPGFRAQLRSTEPSVRFECRLNTGVWTDCTDRPRYEGLAGGRQTFAARAIDRAGNVSTEAATTWALRGAARPLALRPAASAPRALCDSTELSGVQAINYHWQRDRTTLNTTTENYKITGRDSGSRLTCTANVTFASGITATYTAPPILVDQTARLTNFTAKTARRTPVATFHLNEDHLVLIRLWCRSTTRTCKPPTGPTDYQQPARTSYVPAGLTKYHRLITSAKKGTNRVNLTRFLPNGLPAGDYKLTIRLARRSTGNRHHTTNFLHQDLRVTKR